MVITVLDDSQQSPVHSLTDMGGFAQRTQYHLKPVSKKSPFCPVSAEVLLVRGESEDV